MLTGYIVDGSGGVDGEGGGEKERGVGRNSSVLCPPPIYHMIYELSIGGGGEDWIVRIVTPDEGFYL